MPLTALYRIHFKRKEIYLARPSFWHSGRFRNLDCAKDSHGNQKIKWHNYVNVYSGVSPCESVKDMQCFANREALAECCLWSIANQELIAQRGITVCRAVTPFPQRQSDVVTLIPYRRQTNPRPAELLGRTIALTLFKQWNRCIVSWFISIEDECVHFQLLTRRLSSKEIIHNHDNRCESGEICEWNHCIRFVAHLAHNAPHDAEIFFLMQSVLWEQNK